MRGNVLTTGRRNWLETFDMPRIRLDGSVGSKRC